MKCLVHLHLRKASSCSQRAEWVLYKVLLQSHPLLELSLGLTKYHACHTDDSADLKPMGSSDLPEWQY